MRGHSCFRQAGALDPACAMCYWGVAFALGPNINAPITEEAAKEAWAAIEQARALAAKASEKERAYITALSKRYVADPKAERAPLDRAYADAMRELTKRFPDDLDAATLLPSRSGYRAVELLGEDGSPRRSPRRCCLVGVVLSRKADHAGAIHLYIHAVEASNDPARAESYADRWLAFPGAPYRAYARTHLSPGGSLCRCEPGEPEPSRLRAYFSGDAVAGNMMYQVGYYPHNIHFFVASASMRGGGRCHEGGRGDAIKESRRHGARFRDGGHDPALRLRRSLRW